MNNNLLLDEVLGGWQVSSVYVIEGGNPMGINHPSFGQPGNNAIGPGETAIITSTTVGGRQIQLYGRISF
jgi:hypothetical protein